MARKKKNEEKNDVPPVTTSQIANIRATMERTLGNLAGKSSNDPLSKAQELIYKAWETTNPEKRTQMAFDALKISRDCADAWNLLAGEWADSMEEALCLYMMGIFAGSRAVGEDMLENDAGYFWGILETRPLMRALYGSAEIHFNNLDFETAAGICIELLEYNPGDNQGARYMLASCYLALKKLKELNKLLETYDEASSFWLYSKALAMYMKKGDSAKAAELLKQAFESNKYIPDILLNYFELDEPRPASFQLGSRDEALIYADEFYPGWKLAKGALEWLKRQADKNRDFLKSTDSKISP